jgi:hypothetical protein
VQALNLVCGVRMQETSPCLMYIHDKIKRVYICACNKGLRCSFKDEGCPYKADLKACDYIFFNPRVV